MHTSVARRLALGIVLAVLGASGTMAHRFGITRVPLHLMVALAVGEGGLAPLPAAGSFVEIGASIRAVPLLLLILAIGGPPVT